MLCNCYLIVLFVSLLEIARQTYSLKSMLLILHKYIMF